MANIALVAGYPTSSSVASTRELLLSLGFTVAVYNSASVAMSDLMSSDIICALNSADNLDSSNLVASAHQSGKPVLCGLVSGSTANSIPTRCGLCVATDYASLQNSIRSTQENFIFTNAKVAAPGVTQVYYENSFISFIPLNTKLSSSAIIIAEIEAYYRGYSIVLGPRGGNRLETGLNGAGVFAAPIAFVGFFYGSSTSNSNRYTADGAALIKAVIDWALEGSTTSYSFSGKVSDPSGAALARRVRAFRRDTGALIGEAISDATTGAYTIRAVSDSIAATLVCYDADGGLKNALIKDRVLPGEV